MLFLNTKTNFTLHTLFISKLDIRCLMSRKRLDFNINVHIGYRFAFKPPGGLCCCSFKVGGIVVGDSLLIVTLIVGVSNCSMFCCTLLYFHSSFAIILMGKRELVALLLFLPSQCLVMVVWLFLTVPRVCLQL